MYNLKVCVLTFDHNTLRDISLWAQGKLNPEVIRKAYPRPIHTSVNPSVWSDEQCSS
jgi:hypothetical protein